MPARLDADRVRIRLHALTVAVDASPEHAAAHHAAAHTPPPTTTPPTTPPPTTTPPTSAPPTTTPPLPVTGADAGPAALIGGGLVSVGAIFALWATMFVRRNRFQA